MTRTCIAPLDGAEIDVLDARLCGAPATTTRVVESLVVHLCAPHAAELDDDREATP